MNEPNFGAAIGRIRKAFRREFEARAEPLDITASQFQVLRRLWEGDGILTCVLTKAAGSDGGTITGVLDRLESKGLIHRERSTEDRRAVRIWLTPAGRDLQQPMLGIIDALNKQALKGLTTEQRKQLMQTLMKVGENLDA